MSLLEMLDQLGNHGQKAPESAVNESLRNCLRDALYRQLPSSRIAELLRSDPERAKREVAAVLEQISAEAPYRQLTYSDCLRLLQQVTDLVIGLGPIEELLRDESVTEIMVNGPENVFYERAGKLYASPLSFADEAQLRSVIDRIVGPLGRRVDESNPMVSARLPQGHRVNVVIPPLAPDGTVLTIRKFRTQAFTLDELVSIGSINEDIANLLHEAVLTRQNIVVSGGTGSGKTTLLNAMSVEIPAGERIITIEDAAELCFTSHPHVVRLEARMRSAEGTGEVTIRDLVINALRMRPDRIVVGECRGAEALDMLQAMNTGHDGSLTTLHANSPSEVMARLVMMCRYGMDLPVSVLNEQIASAFDLIVHLERHADGVRRVTQICRYNGDSDGSRLKRLVEWQKDGSGYIWCQDNEEAV
ncbi:MAG: CpaF family protein [Coriobacteriales bacterium]|jgi:pilus assembly protein CpaF|nr:CpaF family protein [Coriobacteriales bacterium]